MSDKAEKRFTLLLCILGVCAVAYGMTAQNDPVFIVGLVFIVSGYLLIRRKLKASVKDGSKGSAKDDEDKE